MFGDPVGQAVIHGPVVAGPKIEQTRFLVQDHVDIFIARSGILDPSKEILGLLDPADLEGRFGLGGRGFQHLLQLACKQADLGGILDRPGVHRGFVHPIGPLQ